MKKGLSITLIIIGSLILVGLVIVIVILLRKPSEQTPVTDPIPASEPVVRVEEPEVPSPAASPTVPDNWKEFTSVEYETTFFYPPEWGAPEAELITGVGDSLFGFPELFVSFGDGVPLARSVSIASFDEILDAVPNAAAAVQNMRDVYSNRSVSSKTIEDFTVPPVNAALIAYTDPVYVQNPSGSFRGFYAYTLRVQNNPGFVGSIELNELTLQLTDGEQVIQVLILPDPFEPSLDFTAAGSCNVLDAAGLNDLPDACAIPRQLEIDRQNLEIVAGSVEKLRSL